MSWFRSAVHRAVEAGGKNPLTRTVRNVADTVVNQAGSAVSEGAKIIQHRIGAGNSKSFRLTVKRLEEVSVSCRGIERVQLLRRWLVALKEIERLSAGYDQNYDNRSDEQTLSDEAKDSPTKPTMVYYADPDLGTMNFHEVFLYSQALEGITLSMILEAPTDEEVSLLMEIFGLCLAGGKEVHRTVMSSIQDLALVFSTYQDEILVKREELLQYAQAAIAGLKINADISRIDAEACSLMEKLDTMKTSNTSVDETREQSSKETTGTTKALVETLGQIEICSSLEALLLKKKSLTNENSQELHAEKVDKLKVLSESLLNSMSRAEKRILDNRSQKEQALDFRVTKSGEVTTLEKELASQIGELERQKEDLEEALKKVNSSLTSTRARLRNAREERDQFDDASNELLLHLKAKEDDLSKSVSSYRVEADVVSTWISFLQETRVICSTSAKDKEKQVKAELERYGGHFVNLVTHLLTSYKEELEPIVIRIRRIVDDLKSLLGADVSTTTIKVADLRTRNQREYLQKEYWDLEIKFLAAVSIVEGVKKQYNSGNESIYRKGDERVKELFNAIDKMKEEFLSIERPVMKSASPTQTSHSRSNSYESQSSTTVKAPDSPDNKHEIKTELFLINGEVAPAIVQLEPMESKVVSSTGYSSDEIGEWEFDELRKEHKATR
ncbi:uncharacterized protein [Euphorbia lathyris]|uniref:uncharacterized protein n=1 Tax=Euphorbia lathyris TaxID=212925 RepID=UPI003313A3EC